MQTKSCAIIGIDLLELSFGYDEEHPSCVRFKFYISKLISEMTANGYTDFYTNCEYGIPLWAAEAVLTLKQLNPRLRLHVVAFEEQAGKWAPDWRNRYFSVHEQADSVTLLPGGKEECTQFLIENTDLTMYFESQDAKSPFVRFING
jgi:uncharacterized phage-like protein YoqJ